MSAAGRLARCARACAALAMAGAGALAGAVEVKTYDTRITLSPDGSAQVVVALDLAGATAGRLRVPVAFAALEGFGTQQAPAGTTIAPAAGKDAAAVDIDLPDGVAPEARLAFSFSVPGLLYVPRPEEGQKAAFPEGSRLFRHAFVNTQALPIGTYRARVRLPEGMLVHAIREQLPRAKRKEFTPRVELDRFEGRQGAQLQLAGLKQGERTSMELEVLSEKRSILWLLAGLLLAGGFLYGFRDLVKAPAKEPAAPA